MIFNEYVVKLLIILPSIFIAGFVDSIAGGGGLISVPAYLAAGIPPHFALGTNKFSSTFGTLFATITYKKNRMIDLKVALTAGIFALLGSSLGAKTVLLIKPDFLRYILLFLIPVITIFVLIKKDFGMVDRSKSIDGRRAIFLSSLAGLTIGFYDGFFGPGTGTFLILFFSLLLKYDFRMSNGNTKVVNLSSNVAALITFIINGKVLFLIGIPAAICGIAGNLLGSKFAVQKGNRLIKIFFVLVLAILFVKIVLDTF
ncbi:MAG: TSUP family transporter [candidate division WOR-3 bacterium]